jgi:hypothetical protein
MSITISIAKINSNINCKNQLQKSIAEINNKYKNQYQLQKSIIMSIAISVINCKSSKNFN